MFSRLSLVNEQRLQSKEEEASRGREGGNERVRR